MKKFFEKQLNDSTFAPSSGKYFNGEEYQVGDKVLFAMLKTSSKYDENHVPNVEMELIKLNENHFHYFEPTSSTTVETAIPQIRMK